MFHIRGKFLSLLLDYSNHIILIQFSNPSRNLEVYFVILGQIFSLVMLKITDYLQNKNYNYLNIFQISFVIIPVDGRFLIMNFQ